MANTFNNATANLTTTNVTDVYQAPASAGAVSIVLSSMIANVNGTANSNVNLLLTDSSNNILSYILFTVAVAFLLVAMRPPYLQQPAITCRQKLWTRQRVDVG